METALAERLDAMIAREYQSGGETKTAWTKIGTAWETKNGGYRVQLDAYPAPQINRDGKSEVSFLLMPPRENTGSRPSSGQDGPSFDGGRDDAIPF